MTNPLHLLTKSLAPVPQPIASTKPSMSKNEWMLYWLIFAGGFLFSLWISLASKGFSLDDEITHYLFSHQAWGNPKQLLNEWTRPGRNLIHFPFALMPLMAVRVVTLVLAAIVVWLATKLAAAFNLKHLWLIPLFIWFEPWYVALSGAVLTQTPFALVALIGIYALITGRHGISGLCWGYLSLIRHEGIAFSLMFFVWFLLQGRWKGVAGVVAPIAVFNVATKIFAGHWPIAIFFDSKPTEIYGEGTLFHFVPTTLWFAGPIIVILALIGIPRMTRDWKAVWPLVVYPLYWLMHTLIYWKGLFASGGYYHFLMPMAPGFAIAAAYGVKTLIELAGDRPKVVRATMVGITIAAILPAAITTRPYPRDPMKNDLDSAMAWINTNRPDAHTILCCNIYFDYANHLWDQPNHNMLYRKPEEQTPGTLIVWEYKYADINVINRFKLDDLSAPDSGWTRHIAFGSQPAGPTEGQPTVVIFEKQ
ncbi:glycosyltransferase family 87 protein [Sulfuriroseicoccus oceanibius]|uniref:DUF2029 domain-containing protein n=1 Tax=Sulfuriroseicoccus oceanibius TaxID=2707525 RepID=A0A6B3L8D8_9BACT|nr:glycosyltransferase family 87 protein [Sulfuriroseicoccus oceanibius]QQL45011.1 DUF2029 domain-containing protein [Sulfuriroseicoccus oceanibius]